MVRLPAPVSSRNGQCDTAGARFHDDLDAGVCAQLVVDEAEIPVDFAQHFEPLLVGPGPVELAAGVRHLADHVADQHGIVFVVIDHEDLGCGLRIHLGTSISPSQ